ncbi:MAG: hypothetical protein IJU64_01345 [Bacilli bacterium]|nr:hypothetical protein [Bacilli bacterium]
MFGLFDWIWDLLYGISKSMYGIIDNMLACANMLCGIEPIRYAGNEMDFLTFLMRNPNISYAFVGAVGVALVLVVIFGIFAILRSMSSDKSEKSPARIAIQIGKTMLIFLFIPAAMTVLIFFTNSIMRVLYSTTTGGSPDGLGRFLAGAFGQNALKGGTSPDFYLRPDFKYSSTSSMKSFVDLSDYDFFFSWISSLVIIFCLGSTLLMFVDRAISIVILFIFAPISLSTTVLDDGARFKLWRDQFITKFLMGYGCIIAINIYALIIAAVTNNALVFFNNSTLNNVMKIIIIVGGGVSMMRVMALVGNIINPGAGSNELRDNAIATGSFRRAMTTGALAPFRATRGAVNFGRDVANHGLMTTMGKRMGFNTSGDYAKERNLQGRGSAKTSGAGNNKTNQSGAGNNAAKNAINGGGKANNGGNAGGNKGGGANPPVIGGGSGNKNNNAVGGQGSNMVNNAINNSLHNNNNGGDKK